MFEDGLPTCSDCNSFVEDEEYCIVKDKKVRGSDSPKDHCNFTDFTEKDFKYGRKRK